MFSAVYVPEDDRADPVPATTFIHLDANTVLSRHESLYLATEYMCPEDTKFGVHLGSVPERSPLRTRCRSIGNLDGPQSRVPQIASCWTARRVVSNGIWNR